MSKENVELVQAWVAAINRRALRELLEIAHPDIEYLSYLARLTGDEGRYRGHEGLRRYFGELSEVWEWFQVDVDEYRDLGEHVVNVGRLRAKGKASGLEVEERLAWLHTFTPGTGPGRYLRHEAFPSLDEALEAAGAP
jgi:ketosteroid isomerase-like protein